MTDPPTHSDRNAQALCVLRQPFFCEEGAVAAGVEPPLFSAPGAFSARFAKSALLCVRCARMPWHARGCPLMAGWWRSRLRPAATPTCSDSRGLQTLFHQHIAGLLHLLPAECVWGGGGGVWGVPWVWSDGEQRSIRPDGPSQGVSAGACAARKANGTHNAETSQKSGHSAPFGPRKSKMVGRKIGQF